MERPPESLSNIERAILRSQRRQRPPARFGVHPVFWSLGGIVVGAASVLLFQAFQPKPVFPQAATVATVDAAPQRLWKPEDFQMPNLVKPATDPAKSASPAGAAEQPGTMPDPVLAASTMPTPLIRGSIQPLPDVAPGPVVVTQELGIEAARTEEKSKRSEMVQVVHETDDAEAAMKHLEAVAKKLGGGAQRVPEGIVALVPPDKVGQMIEEASAKGLTVRQESWSGEAAERHGRLTAEAERRVAELTKQRDELLKTYYEDAQPVRLLDEDLAAAKLALDKLRAVKNPPDKAMVKIRLVAKAS